MNHDEETTNRERDIANRRADPDQAGFADVLGVLIEREKEKGTPVTEVVEALEDAIVMAENDEDWPGEPEDA